MTIKTNDFLYDLVENYIETNLKANPIWLFGMDTIEESESYFTATRTQNTIYDSLNNAIFGIKLDDDDYSYVIPTVFWEAGVVYDIYDDETDLSTKNFFVAVKPEIESGDYEIFKCIENGYGSKSNVRPDVNEAVNLLDGMYRLPDGYVWKYMGKTTNALYKKFFGRGYMPITSISQVEGLANDGIDHIRVENRDSNSGYRRYTGKISATIAENARYEIELSSEDQSAGVPNFYSNQSLYVQKNDGRARIYRIAVSSYLEGSKSDLTLIGVVQEGDTFRPSLNDYVEILPTVEIKGTGTGASAIPVFDSTNTRIVGIRMLTTGTGYEMATATILDPMFFSDENPDTLDVKCILRPIIAPSGGHGSNIIKELNCKTLCVSKEITSDFPSLVPSTNNYSKVALVKSPSFSINMEGISTFDNRLKIILDDTAPAYIVPGITVKQVIDGEELTAIVHEVDNETLYLVNYNNISTLFFDPLEPLIVENNQNLSINSIETTDYVHRTGTMLYLTQFSPIDRTADKSEQIKLIIDF